MLNNIAYAGNISPKGTHFLGVGLELARKAVKQNN